MNKSNIITRSNIFLCKAEDPWLDPDFISQIQDYNLLREFDRKKQQGENRIASFSKKQNDILNTEMRCIYAKDDPCWGYVDKLKKVISKCINGECPQIYRCNPDYTYDYAKLWEHDVSEILKYGNPNKLRKYYFIDMISDEEMATYSSVPSNEGSEYPVEYDSWQEKKRLKKVKIDPETGRKMVIVGYKCRIMDNIDYETDENIPLWDYEDLIVVEKKPVEFKKAKRIEKKEDIEEKDYYQSCIRRNIKDEVRLIDIEKNIIGNVTSVFLFDNPAEMAYTSSMLIATGIRHGILIDSNIVLALVEEYEKYASKEQVFISKLGFKTGCIEKNTKIWSKLAKKRGIILLNVSDRGFRKVSDRNDERWTCGNFYGITHVTMVVEDFNINIELKNGWHSIEILRKDQNYIIFDDLDNEIGIIGDTFVQFINYLKENNEIPGIPIKIEGVSLYIENEAMDVLGIAHLKFQEY